MVLITEEGLDLSRFEERFLREYNNFSDVLREAILLGAERIEPSHFLLALLKNPDSYSGRKFADQGIDPQDLAAGISKIITPPAWRTGEATGLAIGVDSLNLSLLSERSRKMFGDLEKVLKETGLPRCDERHLLWSVLLNLEEEVVRPLLQYADVDIHSLADQVRLEITGGAEMVVFDPETGETKENAFDQRGWSVIELARREAEDYGLTRIDSLVLLLALVSIEGGLLERGLRLQGCRPKTLHEQITLNLRARRRKQRSAISWNRSSFFPTVQRILEQAAEEARKDGSRQIGESHLLCAFLVTEAGPGVGMLKDLKLDFRALRKFALGFYEAPEEKPSPVRSFSFREIEAKIRERIVGQDKVVAEIMPFIKRAMFGFPREGKPAGVFLFVGETGTGKTEMAKALAEAVYGSEEDLILIEMGQMGTPESRTILIGASPGYVGYGEGKLTNGLRDRPHSVVLFDEVEKAHPTVLDVLLRFLDEGRISDPAGPVRDGRHCLVVLTSNVAVACENPETREEVEKSLRLQPPFDRKPELLSRVDAVLRFRKLNESDYREVAFRQVKREAEKLKKEKGIEVLVEDAVYDLIAKACSGRKEGARAVEREITRLVITPVVDHLGTPRPARIRLWRDGDETGCAEI